MKIVVRLALCALLLAGCGGGKVATQVAELQTKNEELTRRVKNLEDELFEASKTIVQHDQALRQMADRLRSMENSVNKIELGPSR